MSAWSSFMTLQLTAEKRTVQLRQALNFQTSAGYIPHKKNKYLDELQIWQTATRGLSQILKVKHCQVELYNSSKTTATVAYEYATTSPLEQRRVRKIADFTELYQQLLNTKPLQFTERIPFFSPYQPQMTRLACPIYNEQDVIGNLWLVRPKDKLFYEWEINLVQQVANQCAIAFCRTQFYQQAWTQIRELQELNQRKDDFCKIISHEILNHTSSLQIAAQTLENLIAGELVTKKKKTATKVFQLFQQTCQRQTQLVNDLLTFCQLDIYQKNVISDISEWIDLTTWLPKIVEPFVDRVYIQQQHLKVDTAANLPKVKTDSYILERIVVELINNACKYTPEGDTITISVCEVGGIIKLSVSNTGIEISTFEHKQIFEQFDRLSGKSIGTMRGSGLGLALIEKLVKFINASIQLESKHNQTKFTLLIPLG